MCATATLQLARSSNGNWSLIPSSVPNNFPPMALPKDFSIPEAMRYALRLLQTHLQHSFPESLQWRQIGHTRTADGTLHPAYRAEFPTL